MLSFGIRHTLWDTTISGVYHSFQSKSSNTFRKLQKAGKRFVQLQSFIKARKNTFTGLKTIQNCLFSSHLISRQSWAKVLGHFCISGVFSNSHKSNPSPHPTNNVGCNNYQKLMLQVSSGVPNTEKQMKAQGHWPSAFTVLMVSFPNKTKKYAVIHFFAIVLPKWKNNNLKHCVNMHD